MTDGLTSPETKASEVMHGIEIYQKTPIDDFRRRYSSKVVTPWYYLDDDIGHFTTNEYDYPTLLSDIKIRGGLHLAVMGGLDPVLGQAAISDPNLTIVMDINNRAIDTIINGRILPLNNSKSGEEYWNNVRNYHRDFIRTKDRTRWDIPTGQDMTLYGGGWSSEKYFAKTKDALAKGKIKFTLGDITQDGLLLAKKLAEETGIPLRLIYVSNIFNYSTNNQELFNQRLKQGISEGWIDINAQVIDAGKDRKGIVTKVFGVEDYAALKD